MSPDPLSLSSFNGVARLFPLPNLVLFPQVVQPLHIFEPRYRQLTAHALASDRYLALALLKPGWETAYEGNPAIHAIVCLGRIVADQLLEDGRYNLLLRGVSRARIVKELTGSTLYRNARVELLADVNPPAVAAASELRKKLARLARAWLPQQKPLRDQLDELFASELDVGTLCDVFGFALPVPLEFKQQLLETADVERRAQQLLAHLEANAPAEAADQAGPPGYPPGFSDN
jgi:Lon protease-like protein